MTDAAGPVEDVQSVLGYALGVGGGQHGLERGDKGIFLVEECEEVDCLTVETARRDDGEVVVVDSRSSRIRNLFQSRGEEERSSQDQLLRSLKIDELELTTGKPYINDLSNFFRMREKKMFR